MLLLHVVATWVFSDPPRQNEPLQVLSLEQVWRTPIVPGDKLVSHTAPSEVLAPSGDTEQEYQLPCMFRRSFPVRQRPDNKGIWTTFVEVLRYWPPLTFVLVSR